MAARLMGKGKRKRGRINGEGKKQLVSEVLRRRAGCVVRCGAAARPASYSMERSEVGWGFPAISSGFSFPPVAFYSLFRTRGPPRSLYLARLCRPE